MPVKHVEQENTFSATCKLQVFLLDVQLLFLCLI